MLFRMRALIVLLLYLTNLYSLDEKQYKKTYIDRETENWLAENFKDLKYPSIQKQANVEGLFAVNVKVVNGKIENYELKKDKDDDLKGLDKVVEYYLLNKVKFKNDTVYNFFFVFDFTLKPLERKKVNVIKRFFNYISKRDEEETINTYSATNILAYTDNYTIANVKITSCKVRCDHCPEPK